MPKDALVVNEFELLFALLVLYFTLHAHLGRAGRHRLIHWRVRVVLVAGYHVMVFRRQRGEVDHRMLLIVLARIPVKFAFFC